MNSDLSEDSEWDAYLSARRNRALEITKAHWDYFIENANKEDTVTLMAWWEAMNKMERLKDNRGWINALNVVKDMSSPELYALFIKSKASNSNSLGAGEL